MKLSGKRVSFIGRRNECKSYESRYIDDDTMVSWTHGESQKRSGRKTEISRFCHGAGRCESAAFITKPDAQANIAAKNENAASYEERSSRSGADAKMA